MGIHISLAAIFEGIHISLVICVRGYTYHGDTHITVTARKQAWALKSAGLGPCYLRSSYILKQNLCVMRDSVIVFLLSTGYGVAMDGVERSMVVNFRFLRNMLNLVTRRIGGHFPSASSLCHVSYWKFPL